MSEGKQPIRDERIERYLATLPPGIKLHAEFMRSLEDGLLYPGTAVRYWQELPSLTDDGREIQGSKSAWTCAAFCTGRQYAGMLTQALHQLQPKIHYEVWALFAFGIAEGPHIIDREPTQHSPGVLRGEKFPRDTVVSEQMVRDYAREYVIDYFQLHPSNHRFIEILSCELSAHHSDNWDCRVNFSASGDIVKLRISSRRIDSEDRGLLVFVHEYE